MILTLGLAWLFPPAAWWSGGLLLLMGVILLAYRLGWNGEPLVLEPTEAAGPELAVVFIQGEGIPPERYRPVAEAIQRHCASRRLWVALPRFLGDSPIRRETPLVVAQARRALEQRGMAAGSPYLFVAHAAARGFH
ncbi:hypothetical protein [Cyanobium sp. LEGE 06113]|uniref:hypothetical protein n=1 Tax=Cyanobium sp. LEGE 06113 TaxID=1297573 RepID=UPI00187EC9D2|nr:hypothetical protein [Cyanobium sp. LEGE 06113]